MNNQLISAAQVTEEIAENASRFTEFLASDTVEPVRKTITLIPNVVKDILDIALEHKRLKISDSQFRRKAELAQQYLMLQDKNSQRQYQIELKKINANADIAIAEIKHKRETTLTQIETDKYTKIRRIQSEERIQIAKIKSDYDKEHRHLDNQLIMFREALKESSRRFQSQIKIAQQVQSELSQLMNVIMDKIAKGIATEYECRLISELSSLKIQALQNTFDISEGFLNMFSGGK